MKEQKIILNIEIQVMTFEEAKELLNELEALKDKYEIAVTISIFPQANFEGLYKLL